MVQAMTSQLTCHMSLTPLPAPLLYFQDSCCTALICAAFNNHSETVELLLQHKASIDSQETVSCGLGFMSTIFMFFGEYAFICWFYCREFLAREFLFVLAFCFRLCEGATCVSRV